MHLKRQDALSYVSWLLDDAGDVQNITEPSTVPRDAVLIGWQCGFEPMFVAVKSYLPNVELDQDEAVDIAVEFLIEKKWFSEESILRTITDPFGTSPVEPDFIIGGKAA